MWESDYEHIKILDRDEYTKRMGALTIHITLTKDRYFRDMYLYNTKRLECASGLRKGLTFKKIVALCASEKEIVAYLKNFCEYILDKNITMEVNEK